MSGTRFPNWSTTSTVPPKAMFSVTLPGGSVAQTNPAAPAVVIVMDVEVVEVRVPLMAWRL